MYGHLILSAARRTVLNHAFCGTPEHCVLKGPSMITLLNNHGAEEAEREAAEGPDGAESQALHHPPLRRHASLLE
ncbi:hypothetical protein BRADI_4g27734v3 [Brachypodium distachyon]|uniref:Uncharacterized protein n=1 Tax=Brachypodium distachyon TaxID=15368 RepID=A0A2K2CQL8_BRADI|nr:hypothetical protein BRADI_4g27734v3 [Brachypodium distachyon]